MNIDTSTERLANLLGAAALAIEERVSRAVADAGVSREEASVLVTLHGTPGLTIREVSQILGMAHLLLTAAGRDLVEKILRAREEALVSPVAGIDPQNRGPFESGLEELLRTLVTTDLDTFRICRLCDEDACDQERCPVEQCYRGRWP